MKRICYYVTKTGLYLDKYGRFVEAIGNAWITYDRQEAIRMAERYMAFVGIL